MLFKVIKESFRFLIKNPLFFLPRLFITVLWNLVYLELFHGIYNFSSTLNPEELRDVLWKITPLSIIFSQIAIITSSMYPTLTRDFRETGKFDMIKALKIAVMKYPRIFIVYTIPTIIFAVLSLPIIILISFGILTSSSPLIIAGIASIIAIMIITVILFYFTPSHVVIENISSFKSLLLGMKLSRKYLKEVTLLTLFSFLILFISFFLHGNLKIYGITGFWISRIVSTITGTYLFVMNADLYLEVRNKFFKNK